MDGLTREERERLTSETRRVFGANEVDIGTHYYHMPNASFYPSFFAWDSGFNAATMLHVDPVRSARELETLFGLVAADGHMPHEVLIPCAATRKSALRNLTRWLVKWAYDSKGASHLIDPPIYVYSALLAFEKTGDEEWLARIWPGASRMLDYMLDERDLMGDGLVCIVHPWEAGTDLSPQLLPALGIRPDSRRDVLQATLSTALLYRFCNRREWDMPALAAADRFVVEDLTMNCIAIRALDSAAVLAGVVGDVDAASRYSSRACGMSAALEELCWDEAAGCYFPRWGVARPNLARVRTAASLLPLFTGRCRPERARRLVEEHLLNPGEFRVGHVVPFNPHDELAGARPWVERKLWAGHCIWMNFNWMLAIGLREHGYASEADEITLRSARMVAREGLWEFYDSRDGAGRRVRDFTWGGLVLDMLARCSI